MIYSFNFRTLISRQLPRKKRTLKRQAWIYCLLYPAKLIHDEFVSLVEAYKTEMKWNAQRILINRSLVLKFGPGIIIENQSLTNVVNFGYPSDDSRNLIGQQSAFFSNAIGSIAATAALAGVGFIVKVPASLGIDITQLTAFVKLYTQQSSFTVQLI